MREFAVRPGRAAIEMNVDLKAGHQWFATTSKNIGIGGMFVTIDRRLEVGDRLTVEFELPGHVRPMAVGAEVRWIRKADDNSAGIGIRFVDPSFGVTVAIHEVLRIWGRV